MRFTVARDKLGEAVAFVARALPSRPVIPMLSGMLLAADQGGSEGAGGLTLSCFDYEVSARTRVEAEVAEPGSALVPGRLLAEITRSLPDRPAAFASEADQVSLACGQAEFGLVCLADEDYPKLPDSPPAMGTVDGGALAAAIGQVAQAASRDDTVPLLTAVCIEASGEALTLAATDRYRLAVRQVPFEPAVAAGAVALVPARIMAEAARMLDPAAPVTLAFGTGPAAEGAAPRPAPVGARLRPAEGMISMEAADRRLTTRLISGEFINYRGRFPDTFGYRADVPAGPLIAAVRRASLVAGRLDPVRLSFGGGQVVIEAHAEGKARAAERVPAEFAGDPPVMSFQPHYLLDGLLAAAAGQPGELRETSAAPAGDDAPDEPGRIRLEFTDPAKPALITWAGDEGLRAGGPAFRYLVVPMRVPVRG